MADEEQKLVAAEIPAGHHPLPSGFCFWYLDRKAAVANREGGASASYDQLLKRLGTFNSVEGFWSYYSHLVRPNELATNIDVMCFREGVSPLWEDKVNLEGGKWVLRLKKGMASRCWESVLLALIGDHFHLGEEICGLYVSTKYAEDVISVWNKNASDRQTTLRIRDVLKKILQVTNMPNIPLTFLCKPTFISARSRLTPTRPYRSPPTLPWSIRRTTKPSSRRSRPRREEAASPCSARAAVATISSHGRSELS
jgi:translation initiation factor 4E